jgi:ferredoxin
LFGPACETEVPEGGPLIDVCDALTAPVPFSCRSATCATCLVEIVSGLELLEPPGAAETELLEILGEPPERRLACQARLRSDSGLVQIRVAGDEI